MERVVGARVLRSYVYSIVAILGVTGIAGSQFEDPTNTVFSAHGSVVPLEMERLQAQPFTVLLPNGEKAEGWIAIPPDARPHALVVLCHAYGSEAEDLQSTLVELAEHGAVAVAMQFRGPVGSFNVENGVEDTVAATEFLLATYPSIETTIIYGFSMGGAVSGITVATMPPGTFDFWVAGAPVVDLVELWQHAELFRSSLETETGGRPGEAKEEYEKRSPASLVEEITEANLTSAVLVHARADPIVRYSDVRDLYTELAKKGVPTSFIAVTGTKVPWACSRLETICMANPWATLESHMVGHVPTMMPLLLGLVDGSWTPEAGFHEIQAKDDERVARLLP